MRAAWTVGVWTVSLLSLAVAGLVAAIFILIALSLDPTDIITAGIEPWTDAAVAACAFTGLALVTALSLRLWYSARFWAVGVVLTVAEAGGVAWTCARVYNEYF